MNAARTIGRIGVLAVALGIGMGVSSNLAVATADEAADSSAPARDTTGPAHRGSPAPHRAPRKVAQTSPTVNDENTNTTTATQLRASGAGLVAVRPAASTPSSTRTNSAISAPRGIDVADSLRVAGSTLATAESAGMPDSSLDSATSAAVAGARLPRGVRGQSRSVCGHLLRGEGVPCRSCCQAHP